MYILVLRCPGLVLDRFRLVCIGFAGFRIGYDSLVWFSQLFALFSYGLVSVVVHCLSQCFCMGSVRMFVVCLSFGFVFTLLLIDVGMVRLIIIFVLTWFGSFSQFLNEFWNSFGRF